MKTLLYNIGTERLEALIKEDDRETIKNAPSVLIQIFFGEDISKIEHLLQELTMIFPHAVIIGASSDGEIENSHVSTKSTVVAISLFYKTQLQSYYSDVSDDFKAGRLIAGKLVNEKSKLLISFAGGVTTNGERYLEGIYTKAPNIMVAGGLSGDNAAFQKCYVIYNAKLYEKGKVAVVLDSDSLQVRNFYNFGWEKIGLQHTITESKENRVLSVDGINIIDFYKKYLGEEVADALPTTAVEFPLIKTEDGVDIARAALARHSDGSMSFAGNLHVGEKVYLGVGNANKILMQDYQNDFEDITVESFFVYSCMARRRFMPNLIENELKPFAKLAPTSGFFTYGEFYTSTSPKLLNETFTAIALCENQNKEHKSLEHLDKERLNTSEYKTYNAMSHLVAQITKEYEIINKKLEHRIYLEKIHSLESMSKYQLLIDSMNEGLLVCDNEHKIIDMNATIINLLGYSREELLGESIDKYVHNEDDIDCGTLYRSKNEKIELTLLSKDGKQIVVLVSRNSLMLNKKIAHLAILVDITEMKEKDKQLIYQSKLVQMGEMVNMIAHQWRQPLNAISTMAIKISMKNTLHLLEENEISDMTKFIQDMTQKMSKTINDFMNLSRLESKEKDVSLNDIFEDVFSLVSAQLVAHKIKVKIDNPHNIHIVTHKHELEHILINLIVNARDALENSEQEEKCIIIEAYKDEHQNCCINVKDNAGGVPEAIIEKIFELYFTTKKQGHGTGLGLYMSKKIVHDILNGDLSVKNDNNGAVFSLMLREGEEICKS